MILENFGKLNLRFYVVPTQIVYHNYIGVYIIKLGQISLLRAPSSIRELEIAITSLCSLLKMLAICLSDFHLYTPLHAMCEKH